MNLSKRLTQKVWLIDGLKEKGFQQSVGDSGKPPFFYNLSHPEKVGQLYRTYARAGADILLSNTYQAVRPVLKSEQADHDLARINARGVRLARQNISDRQLVAGTVGPADLDITPWGKVPFADAVAVYREQIAVLVSEKVAAIFYDGFSDIQNLRAALIAAREVNDQIPLIALAEFNAQGKMQYGTDAKAYSTILAGLKVAALGADHPDVAQTVRDNTTYPVVSMIAPDTNAASVESQLQAGIQLFCCSADTLPEEVHKYSRLISRQKVTVPAKEFPLRIASATTTLEIGPELPFVKVGERINPTGRKALAKSLTEQDTSVVLQDAQTQQASGAHALDVNLGAPMVDEPTMMQRAICAIQPEVALPLVIDSTDPAVIELALGCYAGKALVNSINGKDEQLERLIPLVRKFGAALVGLSIDKSVLGAADRKLQIAKHILQACAEQGIDREHIIIDTAAMAVATSPATARETLKAIQKVKDHLALPVILGISNTSFGLPQRSLIHNTFLAQAMAYGLDAAIINPLDPAVHATIAAASLLCGRDADGLAYIHFIRNQLSRQAG